ncbi:hypothetical protein [Rhodococcus sp. 077-4]|uniref:hypothetical protein n=1 Tax=Rhodococcus sp. 077-4 TaxID=2789271 RepID=UPI0039F4B636
MSTNDHESASDFDKWVAISLALPEYVHLETVTSIMVNDDYLQHRGIAQDTYDSRWLRTPLPVQIGWRRIEKPTHPIVELTLIASEVLDEFLGHTRTKPATAEKPDVPGATTVAVCVVPVHDLDAAFTQQDGVLDVVTLANLLVADTIRALRMMTGIPLKDVLYRQLSSIVPTLLGRRKAETVDWSDGPVIFLQHSMADLVSSDPISADDEVVLGQALYQLSIGRPAAVVRDHVGRAGAATASGDHPAALVAYATACEVALDNFLTAMMWEEGMTPADAADGWDNSLANRIKRNYASRLGGNWSMKTSTALTAYSRDVAKPRHRIVHAGETVDGPAVERAAVAAEELFSFVTKLLVSRGASYPKTISLLLGRDSLQRYGGEATRSLLKAHEDHNDRWEHEFGLWRKQWFDLVWGA